MQQKKLFFRIKTSDVGKTVPLYNGRIQYFLTVGEQMVGYRFGEFVLTKRLGSGIHSKKSRKSKRK
jgi:ribosomal protein S19